MHRLVFFVVMLFVYPALAKDHPKTKKAAAPKHAEATKRADPFAEPNPAPGAQNDKLADASAPPQQRGPTRIDFDDRLIQGQSNSAGSVYLYDRKQLELEPMVKKRDSFFTDVIDTAQGRAP
jgi:hypothetical protein